MKTASDGADVTWHGTSSMCRRRKARLLTVERRTGGKLTVRQQEAKDRSRFLAVHRRGECNTTSDIETQCRRSLCTKDSKLVGDALRNTQIDEPISDTLYAPSVGSGKQQRSGRGHEDTANTGLGLGLDFAVNAPDTSSVIREHGVSVHIQGEHKKVAPLRLLSIFQQLSLIHI